MKVISLFDGISCGFVALKRANIEIEKYIAYEIDKYAIKISEYNFPEIEHKGDVTTEDFTKYKGFDLLIGGSPCQDLSIAKKDRKGLKGSRSCLFFEYVRALNEIEPKYFLYENVASMSKENKDIISKHLGVEPIMINSSLVSAQQRKRLYWTNIPNITQPIDKHIYLKDVFGICNNMNSEDRIITTKSRFKVKVRKHNIDKSKLVSFLRKNKLISKKTNSQIAKDCNVPITKVEHWFRQDSSFSIPDSDIWEDLKKSISISDNTWDSSITEFEIKNNSYDMANRIYNINGKHPTLTTIMRNKSIKNITDGYNLFNLTLLECERLQTLPDNYTKFGIDENNNVVNISDNQRYKCIGNGWTVDVIAHILNHIK